MFAPFPGPQERRRLACVRGGSDRPHPRFAQRRRHAGSAAHGPFDLELKLTETIFFRLPVMEEEPDAILEKLMDPLHRPMEEKLLVDFASPCQSNKGGLP